MRIRQLSIDDIQFNKKEYSESLLSSIKRIGFSFPIQVRIEDDKYICVDGHKRLSALEDILKEDPSYKRGRNVHVVIKNNGDQRSNDCSRGRNTH